MAIGGNNMAKWARIENSAVVELVNFDPTGRFPEFMEWVSCPDTVQERWTYNKNTNSFTEFVLPKANPQPEVSESERGKQVIEGATIGPTPT